MFTIPRVFGRYIVWCFNMEPHLVVRNLAFGLPLTRSINLGKIKYMVIFEMNQEKMHIHHAVCGGPNVKQACYEVVNYWNNHHLF